ncbi:hypothetical protein Pmani_007604 [Petrolisthes manimaculis]|uniref:Uncharacterized protein n=1 Tax=Petrolisthes manimaculis TaxID=1843537 RepID=A0AAE1UIJ2_9EUCA|nr:hypothetical protein Pmani_007604 [Petrolisthes manimaculis]
MGVRLGGMGMEVMMEVEVKVGWRREGREVMMEERVEWSEEGSDDKGGVWERRDDKGGVWEGRDDGREGGVEKEVVMGVKWQGNWWWR